MSGYLFVFQVVVGDGGAGADSAESADEGGAGGRPRCQNPDESAERREEERVSGRVRRREKKNVLSLSLTLCVSRPQLCPAAQSEALSARTSSRRPIATRLRGPPRFPEGSAGRQDGIRCRLATSAAASSCAAV